MSVDKIKQLITSVARGLEDNEKIVLPLFASKLEKAAAEYPADMTIAGMKEVISKLATKQTFLTRGEVKGLYKKLYTRNTKFAQVFDEIGIKSELTESKKYDRSGEGEVDMYNAADAVLSNALESVFDKSATVKMYSKTAAANAKNVVSNVLDIWGVKASSLEVDNGDNKFIIVKASYETPKGMTSVLVPVEISNDLAIQPDMFVGNSGPKDINNSNITDYVKAFAGSKLNIGSAAIIEKLASLHSAPKEVSSVEMAVISMNAGKGSGALFANAIMDQSLNAESVKDVALQQYADPEAVEFSKHLESEAGLASLTFGASKVKLGKELIARGLTSFKNAQINVANCNENSITYAVSINDGRVAFKVPVKISNNKVFSPEILISNGSVATFSEQSVNELLVKNVNDFGAAATASSLRNLKASDIVETVKTAISEDNLLKAEDALNVLASMNDQKNYNLALSYFINNVGTKKVASESVKCSLIVKSASSQHPVCGHTGLPLHKVYTDEHGQCAPLYRKASDKPGEGAFFMNSKIFG